MRILICCLALSFLQLNQSVNAGEKAAHTITIKDVQGGFVGFTGDQLTISADGTWQTSRVFNQRLTSTGTGKLTADELKTVQKLLKENEVEFLPATLGKPVGANPHVVTITHGKKSCVFTLQTSAPLPGGKGDDADARFTRIYNGVTKLVPLRQPKKPVEM